ncbi:hypothetical protein BKM35_22030 [Salmonella enterica]|nr:hypothetical protein [Salmonella enterica]
MICHVSRAEAEYADQNGLLDEMDAARDSFIERRADELRQQAITRGHVRFNGELLDVGEILGPLEHQTDMQVFAAIYSAINGNPTAIMAALNDELQQWCEDAAAKEWQQECHQIPEHPRRAGKTTMNLMRT